MSPAARLWELDVARTVAIAMMVIYHAAYDVTTLAPETGVDAFTGGWRALQVATGSSFMFIVGVSFMVSEGRALRRGLDWSARYRRHARRALQVLAAAALVSLGTFVVLGDEFIRFGILHVIGVSVLLAPFFARLGLLNLPLGAAAIAAGLWLEERTFGTWLLMPLGFRPEGGELGVDYYPLLPWFGLALLGMTAGALLYPMGERAQVLAPLARVRRHAAVTLGAPGRNALVIYLAHQLVLLPLVAAALVLGGYAIDLDDL